MASIHDRLDDDELGPEYNDEALADVSTDEHTADAPQHEDEKHRRIRRLKNAKRAKRRRNIEARVWNAPYWRNLNSAFAVANDREYNTLIGNIAEAALLAAQLPQNLNTERQLQLTQRGIIQLDQQDPMPSVQRSRSRSERHASTAP